MPKQGNPFTELLPRNLLALFGAHNLTDPYEIGRTSLSPERIQVHEDWNPNLESFDADIAIITFEAGAIMFSTYVQPICLWNDDTPPTQTEGHVGGWGQSQNLEKFFVEIPTKLKVPIHANEFCFLTTKNLVDLASNRTFCAGRGDGSGICDGDSGGGVSIKDGSTFFFRGIVSSGLYDQIGCDVSKFAIFTDVLKFKLWIDQIMREDGEILIPDVIQVNLTCTIQAYDLYYLSKHNPRWYKSCRIEDQEIDGETFSVVGDPNEKIPVFDIRHSKGVKFLPENIAESFPGLIVYKVWNCSIKIVNLKHFRDLYKLECLDLVSNEIESIDGDSFEDLTKLAHFNISYNKIKTIDPNWFQSLKMLEELGIGHNQIQFLDEKIFDNLQNIKEIALSHNKISTIPANLFKNNLYLEQIWLNENKIKKISSTMFDHLNDLTHVGLQNNLCVNDLYRSDGLIRMKNFLSMYCRSPDQIKSLA